MAMQALKRTTEQPEVADRFNRVLGDTIQAMDEAQVQYAFIGGIASGGLGRPRSTRDIDVFVRPEDNEIVLRSLAKHGFKTEKTDPSWLYKAFKENVLVDVIFKSKGEIYLDPELYKRTVVAEFHGRKLRLVAPEDLIIIKAMAHSELTPGHWHDALALLSHAQIDWEYLVRRARKAPRRVLSLFLYAQSNDIWIPKSAIDELYRAIFGDQSLTSAARPHERLPEQAVKVTPPHPELRVVHHPDWYAESRIREAVAKDKRTNELDIEIEAHEGKVLLRGEVQQPERKAAVEAIARETCPNSEIINQIRVVDFSEPPESEEVK